MPTNDIDKLFKEGLQSFEATPKDETWGKILLKLYAMPITAGYGKYLLFIYGGLLSLFVSVPLLFWFAGSNSKNDFKVKLALVENVSSKVTSTSGTPNFKLNQIEKKLPLKKTAMGFKNKHKSLITGNKAIELEKKATFGGRNKFDNISTTSSDKGSISTKTKLTSNNKSNKDNLAKTLVSRIPILLNNDPLTNPLNTKVQIPFGFEQIEKHNIDYFNIPSISPKVLKNSENYFVKNSLAEKQELNHSYYKLKGLYVGLIGSVNTVWILNQNTYGQWGKYELAYKVKLGYSYGGLIGYDIGNRFGIQLEYHYRSQQGQDYQDRIKRKNYTRLVNLQYENIPLIFKVKIPTISKEFDRPASVNFIFGAQYSILKYANQKVNNQEIEISERFNRSDLALIIGLEYNAYITNRLFFSAGLRGTFGVMDINAKDWENANGTKSSTNSAVGVNVGLNYKIFN